MTVERTDGDEYIEWRIHPSRHTVDLALYDDRVEFTFHDCAPGEPLPHLVELIHTGYEADA
jgi:hypothetical protein